MAVIVALQTHPSKREKKVLCPSLAGANRSQGKKEEKEIPV